MFVPPLDALLFFTATTPLIGLLDCRIWHRKLVGVYALLGFVVPLTLLWTLYHEVLAERTIVITLGFPSTSPMGGCLEVDTVGVFMAMVFLVTGLMVSVHSIRCMEHDTGLAGYYTLLLGMVAGMVGVVFAGDLFTLFIFWEVMCVSSYALVAFRKEMWEPVEAGYKYLIMSTVAGVTLLFAISLLYGMAGTLNLAYLSVSLAGAGSGIWMYLVLTMIIAGFGLQAGIAPLHTWLPDAHSAAPSPVSALLSGAMVKTGVYGLIRVLILVFNPMQGSWRGTLAIFAILTMFTGNLMALLQDDIKRLLAFSTIANIGYILLGLATGSLQGLTGCFFHILNHAVIKTLLFLCTGSFVHQANTRSLKELRGIRRAMPITSAFFIIGTIAMAGIPPLNFFWSELTIVMAGISTGMPVFSTLMVVNLALTAAYCLRLIQTIMSMDGTTRVRRVKEAPVSMLAPTLILALLSVMIGLYPSPFHSMAEEAAQAALDIAAYVDV